MADSNQYLRLTLTDRNFLLPSTASLAIEQKDSIQLGAQPHGSIIGHRNVGGSKWPVLLLSSELQGDTSAAWTRAVFVGNAIHAVGIAVNEVMLLPRQDTEVEPFNPVGPPPTSAGHIFSGAWIHEGRVVLVLDPKGLSGYLQTLAGGL
ncbi:MAG: hypothetical protein BMS9Abin11_0885 [Gammaproteobacteria bacterium]|nr:MAG: hypothetical protein BMS9Abin11_0885 [Gammaproteobacteria bacterium]